MVSFGHKMVKENGYAVYHRVGPVWRIVKKSSAATQSGQTGMHGIKFRPLHCILVEPGGMADLSIVKHELDEYWEDVKRKYNSEDSQLAEESRGTVGFHFDFHDRQN